MALPAWQAAGTAVASNTTNIAPAWPTHAVDDIGLCIVEDTGGATPPATPAGGWAAVTGSPVKSSAGTPGSGDTRLSVFWKRATSTSEAAPTVLLDVQANHIIGQIHTFRGCIATGDPWNITDTSVAATTDTAVSVPGGTTSVADCLIALIASRSTDSASTTEYSGWTNADLANVAERGEAGTALGNGGGFAVATGEKAVAGSFGATTATLANTATQARLMVALKPPASTAYTLTATGGSFAITGTAATLKAGRKITADGGAFSISGTAAGLLFGRKLSADAGAFTISGTAASLLAGRKLSADSGACTITGTTVGLFRGWTLIAGSGAFVITGTAAGLRASRLLTATSGSFLLTGTGAGLYFGRLLETAPGEWDIDGTDADLRYPRRLVAASGLFLITGTPATLIYSNQYYPIGPYRSSIGVSQRFGASVSRQSGANANITVGARLPLITQGDA